MSGTDRALYATYLQRIPMLRSCSPGDIEQIAELGVTVTVPPGRAIIHEGEPGDQFFVITRGAVEVTRAGRHVAELGPGDYFGELALFDPSPRNATVSAASDVAVVALSRNNFGKVLDEVPAIRDALLHGMAHRLHELDSRA